MSSQASIAKLLAGIAHSNVGAGHINYGFVNQSPKQDFALYLANHSVGGPKVVGKAIAQKQAQADAEKTGILDHIFQVLDPGRQFIQSSIRAAEDTSLAEFGKAGAGFAERVLSPLPGLSMKHADKIDPKIYGSDLLDRAGYHGDPKQGATGQYYVNHLGHVPIPKYGHGHHLTAGNAAHGFAGFAIDMLTDPLTYTGLGAIETGAKAALRAFKGGKALEAADELTVRAATEAKGQGGHVAQPRPQPEAFGTPTPRERPHFRMHGVGENISRGGPQAPMPSGYGRLPVGDIPSVAPHLKSKPFEPVVEPPTGLSEQFTPDVIKQILAGNKGEFNLRPGQGPKELFPPTPVESPTGLSEQLTPDVIKNILAGNRGSFNVGSIEEAQRMAQPGPSGLEPKTMLPPSELSDQVAQHGTVADEFAWGPTGTAKDFNNPKVQQEELASAPPRTGAAFSDYMRSKRLAKAGKVTDGKGNISIDGVNKVVEDIQNGKVLQFGPEPKGAEGAVADIAKQEMENLAASKLTAGPNNKRVDFNPANQRNAYNRAFAATEKIFRTHGNLIMKYGARTAPKLSKENRRLAKQINLEADIETQVNALSTSKSNKKAILENLQNQERIVPVNAPYVLKARAKMAREMLKTMEDHAISLGHQPIYWNGMRVRLSDILEALPHDAAKTEYTTSIIDAFAKNDSSLIKNPEIQHAIEVAIGRRASTNADVLQSLSTRAQELKDQLKIQPLPVAEKIERDLPKQAEAAAKATGMTEQEAKAARDLVDQLVNVDKLPVEIKLNHLIPALEEAVRRGDDVAEVMSNLNKQINDFLHEKPGRPEDVITGNKIIDGFMTRVATWYGRGEMKRFSQDVYTWKEMNAKARAAWLNRVAKNHAPEEINAAFRLAQGVIDDWPTRSIKVQKLGREFKAYLDTMLKHSEFDQYHDPFDGSVAIKSGAMMADLNRHLKGMKSRWQFTDSADAVDILGRKRNFSADGEGWLRSIEKADPRGWSPNDPHAVVRFLMDIDQAFEKATAEYALHDEFARRFGARESDAHFDPSHHTMPLGQYDRLDGYKFDPTVAREFKRLQDDLNKGAWAPESNAGKMYMKALYIWKASVTKYLLSHHIRNMVGDSWMMYMAGHSDPRAFIKAAKILKSQRMKYNQVIKSGSLDDLEKLMNRRYVGATDTSHVITDIKGHKITTEQYYLRAHQHGLLIDVNSIDDLLGHAPLENVKFLPGIVKKPLRGKGDEFVSKASEMREHYVLLAHLTAAVEKRMKSAKGAPNMEKIWEDSVHEVRKWHPNGRDMTRFEQKYIRTIIPFYAWQRKAVPLMIQGMVQRPARIMAYPRFMAAMQEANGQRVPDYLADPFPEDQLFPDWIRAEGLPPLFDPSNDSAINQFWERISSDAVNPVTGKKEGGIVVGQNLNPFNTTVSQMLGYGSHTSDIPQNFVKYAKNSLALPLKMPIEIATDTTFTGGHISKTQGGQGFKSYLMSQVPGYSQGANVMQDKSNGRENIEKGTDWQALFNYLTAAGVRGTGPYQKSAEFQQKLATK